MTPPPLSILYEKFIAKICIFLRFWGFFGANVSKDEIRILLLRLVCAAQRAAKKIQNTIRTVGFAKAFCLFAGKNAPKVCGLYWRGKPTRQLKTSIGMLCFTVRRALLATTICGHRPRKYAFWAARRDKNAARNATSAQKTQPCAAFEDKGFTRLRQKNVSPRPFV